MPPNFEIKLGLNTRTILVYCNFYTSSQYLGISYIMAPSVNVHITLFTKMILQS